MGEGEGALIGAARVFISGGTKEAYIMQIASDATLQRASRLRAGGKSWLQLTRNEQARRAGLDFFKGSRSSGKSAK
jgi:hypothetical protein